MSERSRIVLRRRALTSLVLVALLVVTAGCGTRWTDEQEEAVQAMNASGGDGTGTGSEGAAGDGATSDTVAGESATGDSGSGDGADSGAGASDGGGGATDNGGSPGAAASRPCDAKSNAPGVSDDEIVLGTINSLSGPVPGLGTSHLAATQAYIAYRNSRGGVCGRKVVLRATDDGGDNARYRAIVNELHPKVTAFLAGVAGGADGGVEVLTANKVPIVGNSITPGLDRAPTFYGLNPALASYDVAIGKYKFLRGKGASKAAVVYISAGAAPQEAKRQMSLMRAAGIEIVLEQALPLSTLSYDSTARAVANSGAHYLLFFHADSASASMAQSMDDTGYELKFEEYIIAYGSNFIELAGSAAEGASSWVFALPAEDNGATPEHKAFLQWMAQTAPDAYLDTFAVRGWGGAKLLLDSLEALPGPISRDALFAKLKATGDYDAGGILTKVNIGKRIASPCVVGMIVDKGRWRRLAPARGFLC